MKIILILATLTSLMFANMAQKASLAKVHDNMQKSKVEKRSKYVKSKFTQEEIKMQRDSALSAGAPVNMDKVATSVKGD